MEIKKIVSHISFAVFIAVMVVGTVPVAAKKVLAAPLCAPEHTTINIVAHQDDSLLFQSPDLLHDIQDDHCTVTIFVTAGDAGSGEAYWLSREEGVRAAYANMAGVSNEWTQSDAGIAGHPTPVFALASHPNISMAFVRLPDGGVDGNGLSNPVSLKKLWEGSIASLTTIDGSSSYTKQELIDTLAAFFVKYQPSKINTQNYLAAFSDLDHSDHVATGYFSFEAHKLYTTPHTIYAYQGYDSVFNVTNVLGSDLASKINAFFAYTPFDSHACQSYEACTGSYDDWLNRQYIVGSESGGTATAPTDVCPNLDGNQASVPSGYHKATDGSCTPNTTAPVCQSFVSDTHDTVNTGGTAVATFIPPTWTVAIPGATWIWNAYHVANPQEGETVTFTKTIYASTTPTYASIVIGADDNYEASLNGTQFGTTSVFDNFTAGNEDTYDITSLIHQGDNTLSITVHNIATGDVNPEDNPAGLLYRLDLHDATCGNSTTTPPTTDTTTDNTNNTGGSTSSSGGGSGSSLPRLKISNQLATIVRSSGQVLITWATSRPAYGHVIYGIDTGTPYTLDLSKPNFGYPSSAPTDPSVIGHIDPDGKVQFHAITLSGLTPGKKYRYRIVSHASPAVTSEEGYFTVPQQEGATGELAISDEAGDSAIAQQGSAVSASARSTSSSDSASATSDGSTSVTATVGEEGETDGATTTDAVTSTSTDASTSSEQAGSNATALALGGIKSWQWGLIAVIVLALAGWFVFGRKKNNTLS